MAKTDIDIALFADSLIENDITQLKASGTKLVVDPINGITKVNAPDVSKVSTPDSLFESIMEQSFGIKSAKPKVEPKKEVQKEVKVEEEKSVEYYSQELVKLIKQAQSLINEMTSCGSIGVNTAGPGLPTSKNKGMGIKTKKSSKKNMVLDKLKKKYKI